VQIKVSAILSGIVLAGIAAPSPAQDSGAYIGGNAGRTQAIIAQDRIVRDLLGSGFATTAFQDDHRNRGYKAFGGYQFNRHFAIEGGFFDIGAYDFTATTLPPGDLTGTLEAKGLNLDLVGMLPFGERFSAFARVGAAYARTRDSFAGSGPIIVLDTNPSKRDTNVKFGAGLQLDFNERLAMRLEGERYRISDAVGNEGDIDLISLGLLVRLGAGPPPAPRAQTQPPPVLAPVVVVVPVGTEEYCTILDIQYEIDQAEIELAEQERLRVLATFMAKYPDTTAIIEGHTDDVGTAEANLSLSQRRADSVVAYLVSAHGIARSRLTATGHGEARPLADNRSEEGKRRNRRINALIACASDIEGLEPIPARITMAMLIEFGPDEVAIAPRYRDELRKVANFLTANPRVTATVEGHSADASPARAQEISRLRAQNVVNYLVDNFRIPRSRLTAEGFGQTRRVAYNTSAEGREENRRINVIIDYPR
jgi:OOP family OmpA-OmpF porin